MYNKNRKGGENKMKKFVSVVLCLIIAVSLGASCFADAIAVYPDRFTEKHFSEFEILENWHYICASGSVAQKTPLNPIRSFELYENYPYHVRRTYTDSKGVVWGYIAQDNETNDDIATLGWIPMTSMRSVYGSEDFYGEHEYVFPENIEEKNYVDKYFFEEIQQSLQGESGYDKLTVADVDRLIAVFEGVKREI